MNKDFLWGSASAAYQIEGAANMYGKGPSIWDTFSNVKGNTFENTTGAVTVDFYHRYKEDIALMAEMGLKAYRFSISWPRILPDGKGEVNKEGIEFYHNVINELLANNIEPIVTIYHWDLPQNLQTMYNGFESRQIIKDFVNYCKILFEQYGQKIKYWVTLNEQNVFMESGYLDATFPPQMNDYCAYFNANHYATVANAKVIKLYKDMNCKGQIGPSFAYKAVYANSCEPDDVLAMENAQELTNWLWLDAYIKGEYNPVTLKLIERLGITIDITEDDLRSMKLGICDFIGVNYYRTQTIKAPTKDKEQVEFSERTVNSKVKKFATDSLYLNTTNPHLDTTEWNWAVDPVGFRVMLRRLSSRYNIPILITENGLGAIDKLNDDNTINDSYRIKYLNDHIVQMQSAIEEGCSIIGYCSWSFQDLFSWLNGYAKRYGFVYVDRDVDDNSKLCRHKKDSFYWYQQVIKDNGITNR